MTTIVIVAVTLFATEPRSDLTVDVPLQVPVLALAEANVTPAGGSVSGPTAPLHASA